VIRGSGQRLLEALGHKVLLAENGRDALSIYREQKDEIVLVLLDMVMPEMDGEDTFLRLRELDPDVRVLLSSGYMVEDKARRLMTKGARGFIQKPYTLDALAEEMAQALGSDAGRATPVTS
jgi:DNA-binding NtrC family response regulator